MGIAGSKVINLPKNIVIPAKAQSAAEPEGQAECMQIDVRPLKTFRVKPGMTMVEGVG